MKFKKNKNNETFDSCLVCKVQPTILYAPSYKSVFLVTLTPHESSAACLLAVPPCQHSHSSLWKAAPLLPERPLHPTSPLPSSQPLQETIVSMTAVAPMFSPNAPSIQTSHKAHCGWAQSSPGGLKKSKITYKYNILLKWYQLNELSIGLSEILARGTMFGSRLHGTHTYWARGFLQSYFLQDCVIALMTLLNAT